MSSLLGYLIRYVHGVHPVSSPIGLGFPIVLRTQKNGIINY